MWSPTAEKILFQDSGFIYVVDATGGEPLQIARGSDPEWSPDGTRIVYQSGNEIHVVNANGSGDVFVTEGGSPTWSPDGNRIAFTDGTDLATVAADGSDVRYLTADAPADYAPDWSPDGTRIAFLRAAGADVATYVVNAEGGPISRVSDSDAPPEWPLDRPRVESDGTIVAPDGTILAALEIDHNILVTLARNRANRNADLGIEAAEGVIDGGGNGAAGNGDPRQCAGVACS
jgi:dipeptidyl aminopeptidase/acylaminoacyl peptidase